MMTNTPYRRSYIRAFTPGGHYFLTLTLQNRRADLLVRHIDALRAAFAAVKQKHPFDITAICVLPEHLHLLMALPDGDADYPLRVRLVKSRFSSAIPAEEMRTESRLRKGERGIWQRRYWEHEIRDEADLHAHIDYIHFNPLKHGHVARVADWPYSSFHRYVAQGILPPDWGGKVEDFAGCRFGERDE